MKTVLFFLSLSALGIFVASCKKTDSCEETVTFSESKAFELCTSQQAVAPDGKFTLELQEISQDNRCPADVNCIIAGWADAKVKLITKDSSTVRTLSYRDFTTGRTDSTRYAGYIIRVTGVSPNTKADQKIEQKDYRVTFTARKVQ